MTEQEGVIKYRVNHQYAALDQDFCITEMNAWRTILFKLELIAQIEGRYEGCGFGNISQRFNSRSTEQTQFVISGTQTGHFQTLSRQHFCTVIEANPEQNWIQSVGEVQPSSEALTHASVYQYNKQAQCVVHVHSPEIWTKTHPLQLPYTAAHIRYGTPEMAKAVKQVLQDPANHQATVLSLLGHEDGIIAFADTFETAVCSLVTLLSKAIALE